MSPWWAVTAAVAGVCLLVLGNPYTAYKERKLQKARISHLLPEQVLVAAFGHLLFAEHPRLNRWVPVLQESLSDLGLKDDKQAVCDYLLTRAERPTTSVEEKLYCMQALVAVEHDLHGRLSSLVQSRYVR